MASNKVAVVTGAMGGLGETMCKALIQQQRTVVGTYLPAMESEALAWAKEMEADGFSVRMFALDVTDFDACAEVMKAIQQQVGPVDILVNNAGITRDATLKRMEPSQWNDVITTNLTSMFNVSKQVFDGMCERGWGRIVNISSLNGEKGQFGQANYAAAKAGIYGFTRSIALEGARKGVTVNAVSPGYIDTPMIRQVPEKVLTSMLAAIPVGRFGLPEEIARTVAFLTADDAGFITGQNISVNGGQYMS